MMRLDRFVSQATGMSRADARRMIRRGLVARAGVVVKALAMQVTESMQLTLDGDLLVIPGPAYLMLHKPAGLICASQDASAPTVMSLLPEELAGRLHIVGRLDKDTTGLLLLTDDGDWSHRITSPRRRCGKVYRAKLAEPVSPDMQQRLQQGVLLRGEKKPTREARLDICADREVLLTITEGRYHQVKRMFGAVGNRVLRLHREQIGGLALDPALKTGQWRSLSENERRLVFDGLN